MEYAWIDTEDISEEECRNKNNTDGYRRVYYQPKHGEDRTCLVLPNAPECIQGGWTRVNHLGNSRDGVPLNYTWRVPYFPSQRNKLAVIRVRWVWSVMVILANEIGGNANFSQWNWR